MTQHSEQLTRDGDAAQDLGAPEPRWSPRRAAVLGAGSWGTTFAKILTDAGLSGEGPAPEVVLWGRDARTTKDWLGGAPTVESAHPSPLSASRGFFGSRPFSRVNDLLREQGAEPVSWELPG